MQRLSINDPLNYEFTRALEPRLKIDSGETIVVEAEDALSGQIRSDTDRRDKQAVPYSNPVTGPIVVDGARPGDHLAVTIRDIQPLRPQAATYTGHPLQLAQWLGGDPPQNAHVCPIRDGQIHWSPSIRIPYQPMLGCIGTAPAWGVPSTGPAGPHGGNMDIIEVGVGATVCLPVFVAGGYLFLGDAHAAMGHGELSATGLEMSSVTTISVELKQGAAISWPRITTDQEIMVVVSGNPMERSIANAYSQLILWMESEFGWDRWRAYDLLTHVGRISVGYYGIGTVAAKIPRRYLTEA